jgi:GTP cyclohydrolase II
MAGTEKGINGDPTSLLIDRAIGELRRGRAIGIDSPGNGAGLSVVVAALETLRDPLKLCLEQIDASNLRLVLTAERAAALGLAPAPGAEQIALVVPSDWQKDELLALAGTGAPTPATLPDPCSSDNPIIERLYSGALRLVKASRLLPAIICARNPDRHDPSVMRLPLEDVEIAEREFRDRLLLASRARVPLADAIDCEISLFRDEQGLSEHVAVVIGRPDLGQAVPVRLHSACLTGDLLGSLRCDCGEQLRTAVRRIAALGGGVLLYLDQEGRGIGLPNKLRAYALQDSGLDTLEADQHLGFMADERSYGAAAALLNELGVRRVRLLTNNPHKIRALRGHGIGVEGRLPLVVQTNSHNERYIRAKRERAGHLAS